MTGKTWSEKEEKILQELWENPKVSVSDICKVFKERTHSSVQNKAYSMNLLRPSGSVIDEQFLENLRKITKG